MSQSIPMLTLNGTVINSFTAPKGTNQDGQEYGGDVRVQLMCDNPLRNGQIRKDVVTLKAFKEYGEGETVSIPVGVYVDKGQAKFYAVN